MRKQIVAWLIIITLIFPVLTYIITNFEINNYSFLKDLFGTHIDAWVSFFGNYLGGIMGGVVAFLIAKHQIKEQNVQSKAKEEKENKDNERLILFTYFNEILETLKSINTQIKSQQKSPQDYILNFPVVNIPYVQEYLIYISKFDKTQAFEVNSIFSDIRYLISIQRVLIEAKEKWNEVYFYSNIFVKFYEGYLKDTQIVKESSISKSINEHIIFDTYKARTNRAIEFLTLSEAVISKINNMQEKYKVNI